MVKNALTARFPPGPHGQLADRELQHWSKGSKEGEERGKGNGREMIGSVRKRYERGNRGRMKKWREERREVKGS